MTDIPDGLGKILDSKTVEKIYQDGLSDTTKEISKVGVDIVKVARLFLAPFQIASAFQDRFERFVQKIREKVPEENYVEGPPEIIGPAIEKMKYLEDSNPLWQMFEELLISSVDKKQIDNVHPSFVYIISQLSRDEAIILYGLKDTEFEVVDTMDLNHELNRFENLKIEKSTLPIDALLLPDKINLYYSHLESLSLVSWPVIKQDPINSENKQIGIRRYSKMHLTEFGQLFIAACIPENGFI
jgi:hypothetical protein